MCLVVRIAVHMEVRRNRSSKRKLTFILLIFSLRPFVVSNFGLSGYVGNIVSV